MWKETRTPKRWGSVERQKGERSSAASHGAGMVHRDQKLLSRGNYRSVRALLRCGRDDNAKRSGFQSNLSIGTLSRVPFPGSEACRAKGILCAPSFSRRPRRIATSAVANCDSRRSSQPTKPLIWRKRYSSAQSAVTSYRAQCPITTLHHTPRWPSQTSVAFGARCRLIIRVSLGHDGRRSLPVTANHPFLIRDAAPRNQPRFVLWEHRRNITSAV